MQIESRVANKSSLVLRAPSHLRVLYCGLFLSIARVTLIVTIIYTAWQLGGTRPSDLHFAATLLAGATVAMFFAICAKHEFAKLALTPICLFALWIAYGFIQLNPIPELWESWFQSVQAIRNEFGTAPATELLAAASKVTGLPAPTIQQTSMGSVAPELTREAVTPFLLALVVFILSSVVFNTPGSRRCLLWAVVLHSSLLAAWGIIQRATGNLEILPGVANTFDGVPFASFIYKNAGAAAILPGIGAAIALICLKSTADELSLESNYDPHYSSAQSFSMPEPRDCGLIALTALLIVGVLASLSRGAWLASATAVIVCIAFAGPQLRTKRTIFTVTIGMLVAIVAGSVVVNDIQTRAEQLGLDYLRMDQRWNYWADGLATAIAHFPSGSGLGTYGYAILPYQVEPRSFWFREAHNQYLETLTEMGIIGIAIVAFAMIWFAARFVLGMTRSQDAEVRIWSALGLFVFLCGAIQSTGDFVLTIPANTILYASILGVASTTLFSDPRNLFTKQLIRKTDEKGSLLTNGLPGTLFVSTILACASYGAYQLSLQQQLIHQQLSNTKLKDLDQAPDPDFVANQIAALDSAIEILPQSAALHRNRAGWFMMENRLDIISEAALRNETLPWLVTQPERVFIASSTQAPAVRTAIQKELLATPALKQGRMNASQDIAASMVANPLMVQSHLAIATAAPILGESAGLALAQAARLSNSNPDRMYFNGLLAYYAGETDLMVDQWSRNLSQNHDYLHTILKLSLDRLEPIDVARRIIPRRRPDLFVRLANDPNKVYEANEQTNLFITRNIVLTSETKHQLASDLVTLIASDERIEDGKRHSAIAQLYELMGDPTRSLEHWLLAIKTDPRSSSYRHSAAIALLESGYLEDALRHAILGKSLDTKNSRFASLITRIRKQISSSTTLTIETPSLRP